MAQSPESFNQSSKPDQTLMVPETPRDRTTLIIESLDQAITEKRLKPESLACLYRNPDTQSELADILQVYLGMKPLAGFLSSSVYEKSPEFYLEKRYVLKDLVRALPSGEALNLSLHAIDSHYGMHDTELVWDNRKVQGILKNREELKGRFDSLRNVDEFILGNRLQGMQRSNDTGLIFTMGLFHNIPENDARQFAIRWSSIAFALDVIANQPQSKQLLQQETYKSNLMQLAESPLGSELRGEILAVLPSTNEGDVNFLQDTLDYVTSLRLADVPGFRYFTSGDATLPDEEAARNTWRESGIEPQLEGLLAKHRV